MGNVNGKTVLKIILGALILFLGFVAFRMVTMEVDVNLVMTYQVP